MNIFCEMSNRMAKVELQKLNVPPPPLVFLYRTHYTTKCSKVSQFDLRTSINMLQKQM